MPSEAERYTPDFASGNAIRMAAGTAIWLAEAAAIQSALSGPKPKRPLTHDLLASTVSALGGEVMAVLIHQLLNGTFHATLRVHQEHHLLDVDARASDAIALALRVGAEILVHDRVLREILRAEGEQEAETGLSELSAEAFGEYEM